MKSLTNQFVSDLYPSLLHTENASLSSGLTTICDGVGNESSLSLNLKDQGAKVTGQFIASNIVYPENKDAIAITLIDVLFPVGSVFFSLDNNNPSVRFVGTTWERMAQGRFIVGVGRGVDANQTDNDDSIPGRVFNAGSYEDQIDPEAPYNDGEYNHTLTTSELPKHSHTGYGFSYYNNNSYPTAGKFSKLVGNPIVKHQDDGHTTARATATLHTAYDNELAVDDAGGGGNHLNVPPWYGVYIWKRIE